MGTVAAYRDWERIAVHLRKIGGEWRLAVWSTKDSIQDSSFLLPLSVVVAVVFFEPVWVLLFMKLAFIPANFAVIGDTQNSAMGQWDGDDKVFHEHGDDLVFVLLGIHKGQGVVVVHHDADITLAPNFEHGLVDDFRFVS